MKRWTIVGMIVLVGCMASPASRGVQAHESGVTDPSEGEQYRLDIEAAAAEHSAALGPKAIVFTLETYAPFTNAELQQADGEDYAVAIGISTDRDEPFERLCYVHVRPDAADQAGFSPYGVCTKDKKIPEADRNTFSPRERFAGFAVVTRPSEDSVEVTIPVRLIDPHGLERFQWRARMVSSPESGSVYYDYVPDEGSAQGHV